MEPEERQGAADDALLSDALRQELQGLAEQQQWQVQQEDGEDEELEEENRLAAEEKKAIDKIVRAFRDYQQSAEWEIARWQVNYRRLPPHHKQVLASTQLPKIAQARKAIEVNQFLINSLLMAHDPETLQGPLPPSRGASCPPDTDIPPVSPIDVDKVRYVLKNLARDWSSDGAAERQQSYGRITQELQRVFKDWSNPHRPPRVLVPGAGLARLCCEITHLGYEAQGNEYSYYILLASSFVLNNTVCANQYTLHPWLHTSSNHISDANMLRGVTIPDVHPADMVPAPGLLSMCAGDFAEVYRAPDMHGLFDCVVTCFFIDTAHNVLEYLEVINHCLRPGGVWINLGPLLYHWADSHTYLEDMELSIELSLEDVKRAATTTMGFELVREEEVEAAYIADQLSMYKTVYKASFITMIKRHEYSPAAAAAAAAAAASSQQEPDTDAAGAAPAGTAAPASTADAAGAGASLDMAT